MQFMDRKRERPSINISPLVDDILGNVIIAAAMGMYGIGTWLMYEISNVEV